MIFCLTQKACSSAPASQVGRPGPQPGTFEVVVLSGAVEVRGLKHGHRAMVDPVKESRPRAGTRIETCS